MLSAGSLDDIPSDGPLLVVANHPYGAAEGLALADLLLQRRSDVRLLANTLLQTLPELAPLVIPVDVFKSGVNGAAIRQALRHLKDGGVLIVFPAGEVSRVDWRARQISDPPWSPTIALLARRSAARVLPLFVEGRPRLRSLAAGVVNPRLRTALLARDLLALRGQTLGLRIGDAVEVRELARIPEHAQTDYLRVLTYTLGVDRQREASQPAERHLAPLAGRAEAGALAAEVATLGEFRLLQAGEFELYLAPAAKMPPMAGPSRVATPQTTALSAMARDHRCSGKAMRIIASDAETSSPAPKPCTVRPASSTGMLGDSPQIRLPRPKPQAAKT